MEATKNTVKIKMPVYALPEIVFDAWVKPELLQKWLFVGADSEMIETEVNVEPKGRFSLLELNKTTNERVTREGTYLEVERPSRLVFTLADSRHSQEDVTVTVEIAPADIGSDLTLLQTGISQTITEQRWEAMLEQLKLTVENQ